MDAHCGEPSESEPEKEEVDDLRPDVVDVPCPEQDLDAREENRAVMLRAPVHPLRLAPQPSQVRDWRERPPCHV